MVTFRASILSPETPDRTRILPDAWLRVDAGRFEQVEEYAGQPVDVDLRGGLATPGFVDAHLHFPQTRIIGAAGLPLLPWLQQYVFPEEGRFASRTYADAVASEFVDALLRHGTTTAFVYGSVHESSTDALLARLASSGLRAHAGPVLMDRDAPAELVVPAARAMTALERLVEQWHGYDDGRLELAVIPRFGLSCTPKLLALAGDFARGRNLWVSTHLSENVDEIGETTRRFGTRDYLSVYEQAGLVHAKSLFAHCIHLTESEWDRLHAAKAVVAHCPDSNAFLGSGSMPVGEVLERDVSIAIGTDVAAGRSFSVPTSLSHAHDNALRAGRRLTPARLFWWGTHAGAAAIGRPDVGKIAPGFEADLVWHRWPTLDPRTGVDHVLGQLLFAPDSRVVEQTWIRGKRVFDRSASG